MMTGDPSAALLALLVAVGGGAGAVLRYVVDHAVTMWWLARPSAGTSARPAAAHTGPFPGGTVVVNLSGAFLLGLLLGLGSAAWGLWPMISLGVLGGYTTFSTASLDILRLLHDRKFSAVLLYALGTLGGALLLAGAGLAAGSAVAVAFGG